MEEIQKKTKRGSNSKKDIETTKASATAKKTKASSTKKEQKATTTKPTNKSAKSSTAVRNTEAPKVSASTKTTKVAKSTAKKEKNTNAKTEIEINKASTEPKFTIIHEKEDPTQVIKPEIIKEEKQKEKTKKVETREEAKVEDKKEKKAKKQKKGYIDISIGAIICAAIIIGLIILNVKLGIKAYNVVTKNESTNASVETDNDISVTQEVGNVLSSNDEIVAQMKEKITFAPNVTASIYNAETFSTNTISNDLKLRLGWARVKDGNKLKSINENNESIEALEKEVMAESIKNIFGPKIKYKDEAFNNTNVSTFSAYCQNQGKITYGNGLYTSIVSENIEEKMAPIIYQEIQKVVKYSDKVIVYVKVAYMDADGEKYIVYQDFDNEKFEEELLEITPEELFKEDSFDPYTGEGTVTINANTSLDSIRNQLDTYKYTFSLNGETEEYYLTKFNKALSM